MTEESFTARMTDERAGELQKSARGKGRVWSVLRRQRRPPKAPMAGKKKNIAYHQRQGFECGGKRKRKKTGMAAERRRNLSLEITIQPSANREEPRQARTRGKRTAGIGREGLYHQGPTKNPGLK